MVRFIHTADWQLGMRRHYLDADAQGRFNQGRLDAIAATGRLAAEHDAAFVVVAGDVFDDNQVDRRTVLRALDVLAGFPDVPVLLLPGNHDPLDAGSVFTSPDFAAHRPEHVRVVTDGEPIAVAPGVEVVGAPWRTKRPGANPSLEVLAELDPAPDGVTRVLLAHGGLDAAGGSFDQPGILRVAELDAALADGRVHFVALGDRHSADGYGATGRIWYAGAPEPTNHRERNPGHALLVDVTPDAVEVTPHRVGRWTFRQERFEVAGAQDVAAIERWLDEPADKPHTCAKLGIRGTLSLAERERLEVALARAEETYAAVERWARHDALLTAPSDADLEAMQVGGFVAAALEELRAVVAAAEEDPSEACDADAQVASDALALLYRTVVGTGGRR